MGTSFHTSCLMPFHGSYKHQVTWAHSAVYQPYTPQPGPHHQLYQHPYMSYTTPSLQPTSFSLSLKSNTEAPHPAERQSEQSPAPQQHTVRPEIIQCLNHAVKLPITGPGFIVHIGNDSIPAGVTEQSTFLNAESPNFDAGFAGIGCQQLALEYIKVQMELQKMALANEQIYRLRELELKAQLDIAKLNLAKAAAEPEEHLPMADSNV
ncbi:hypothetical protein D9619_010807 [Psilocybe cf. subviscida]|uniref:Uncharacterized protein n=1 Tax=Psilocybe cf. subviscida TaxID=2480587 RepID=A0A8H5EZZ7_9AGAR|nr:hypothetical protein D9619_010807 [Psilocybe cf. subviscida]